MFFYLVCHLMCQFEAINMSDCKHGALKGLRRALSRAEVDTTRKKSCVCRPPRHQRLCSSFQMLQLWRSRTSRQRVPAAPSAQKVPFLSEHLPHGGRLSGQSAAADAAAAADATDAGKLRDGRGGRATPETVKLPQVLFIEMMKVSYL